MRTRPQVAIAHDYLTQRGGAERVVLAMVKAFPDAPIYTTLYDHDETYSDFAACDVRTSWLNRIGLFRRSHRLALPLLPFAASSMRVDADVVLVSSSGWAHGFRTKGRKVVYCYSPPRWLYQTAQYLGDHPSRLSSTALSVMSPFLRRWDRWAARSVDEYISISAVAQTRILAAYGLDSRVVPAPRPDTGVHEPTPMDEVVAWLGGRSFELCVSRLLPYKNVDVVVDAYTHEPERRLIVVGRGPEKSSLMARATPNVLFLENIAEGELAWLYELTTALVTVSYEDFGLTPLEAASFGKPSIVLRWGGFIETMVEGVTAVFVESPHAEDIRAALGQVDAHEWDAEMIREHADRYSEGVFIEAIRDIVKAHQNAR